jgi:hypothetical protein
MRVGHVPVDAGFGEVCDLPLAGRALADRFGGAQDFRAGHHRGVDLAPIRPGREHVEELELVGSELQCALQPGGRPVVFHDLGERMVALRRDHFGCDPHRAVLPRRLLPLLATAHEIAREGSPGIGEHGPEPVPEHRAGHVRQRGDRRHAHAGEHVVVLHRCGGARRAAHGVERVHAIDAADAVADRRQVPDRRLALLLQLCALGLALGGVDQLGKIVLDLAERFGHRDITEPFSQQHVWRHRPHVRVDDVLYVVLQPLRDLGVRNVELAGLERAAGFLVAAPVADLRAAHRLVIGQPAVGRAENAFGDLVRAVAQFRAGSGRGHFR